MMLGWSSAAAVRASRRNRSMARFLREETAGDYEIDATAQLDLGGYVHDAHPAPRQLAVDLVVARGLLAEETCEFGDPGVIQRRRRSRRRLARVGAAVGAEHAAVGQRTRAMSAAHRGIRYAAPRGPASSRRLSPLRGSHIGYQSSWSYRSQPRRPGD